MREKLKKFSQHLDNYIKTKKFKWYHSLTIVTAFAVTGCVCFLAGFFMNRDDNMLYQNHINAISESISASTETQPPVTTVPPEVTTTPVVTTTKISVSSSLLNTRLQMTTKIPYTEYQYTNSCSYSNRSSVNDFDIPLTKKSFRITYDGVITAGIDSSLISLTVDNESRIISVILPEAEIISHEVKKDSFIISNVSDNYFNPILESDYMDICMSQNNAMETEALQNGLMETVYQEASDIIEECISADDTVAKYYTINFIVAKNF